MIGCGGGREVGYVVQPYGWRGVGRMGYGCWEGGCTMALRCAECTWYCNAVPKRLRPHHSCRMGGTVADRDELQGHWDGAYHDTLRPRSV